MGASLHFEGVLCLQLIGKLKVMVLGLGLGLRRFGIVGSWWRKGGRAGDQVSAILSCWAFP